jgi:hypothetical protein
MRLASPTLLLVGLLAAFAAACEKPPVEWSDPKSIAGPSAPAHLVFANGEPQLVPDATPVGTVPPDSALCRSSLRTASAPTRIYAVWWSVRRDSSAVLRTAWSTDSGKTWGTPALVDSTDISSRGCSRPAASITTVGDDLHIAYSMIAPEGTGVFFAHFMQSMLHSPVAVIYGERIVPTAIAAEGDRVAVAYEEPNGTRKQVDVALSQTQGHIFEWHATASRDIDGATQPAIALSGNRLAVAWATRRSSDSTVAHVVREGRIR